MKMLKYLLILVLLSSCARATFKFGENGKLVKEPRLRPGKGYPITVVFTFSVGELIKPDIKHIIK